LAYYYPEVYPVLNSKILIMQLDGVSTMSVLSLSEQQVQKLEALKTLLPSPPNPIGSYVPILQVGSLLYTSGVLPIQDGKIAQTGALGSLNVSLANGQKAARLAILNALSLVSHKLDGRLDQVIQIVKLTGYVNSLPTFSEHPQVINGASDLLTEYFGERGRHVRSAVGVNSLPCNASVELELIVAIA
jgi:enamine deaminase RidA (YjgF/YER057c/UK114 family)